MLIYPRMKRGGAPLIGLTCDVNLPPEKPGVHELCCDHRYVEAVTEAGGLPVLVPFGPDLSAGSYLERLDGLLMIGGADIDPQLYGEDLKPGTNVIFAPRLDFERGLYRAARERKLPTLAICYGMQLVNVLEGGTLHQDIPRDAGSARNHRNRERPRSKVRVAAGSRLAAVLGIDSAEVYCSHHQAVARVAPGFQPVAFAEDGIIEAIESPDEKLLAVQWHPERIPESQATKRLFQAFLRLCK